MERKPRVSEAVLLANREKFLGFLEKRVGSRAAAEDLLQAAYLRALEADIPEGESAVAWFYRVLRNALVDRHRRESAHPAAPLEAAGPLVADDELKQTV